MKFDHVVIGGSAGAVSAVEAIRNLDKKAAIVVVHDEAALAYSRPLISKLLTGEKDLEGIIFRSGEFWKKYNVQLIHDKAIEIDADDRTLTLARGRRIEFGDLLLAVGGEPITPRIEGSEEQVYTFTTIADVERLSPLLPRSHRVVVVGGGLIGVSLSEALCKIGKKVTVVELKDRILSQALDERASSILESKMQQAGVELLTGRSIASMHWQGERVSKIELDTGETMSCDLVVTAIGVRPNIRLAAEAGVTVNHGIVVDDTMQTNFPEVYACGDAAEIYDFVRKAHRPLALWPVARGSGKTAGSNMAGGNNRYEGSTSMNALAYFDTPIITVGETAFDDPYTVISKQDQENNVYKKFVFKDDILVGFTLVGDVEQAGLFLYLMKNHVNVRRLKNEFCSPDFMLTSLPKRVRMEVLA